VSHVTASRISRVVTTALVAGACAALTLAGCSAGQLTQTATQVPAVPGSNVTVGSIALRDLMVQYSGPDGYRMGDNAALVVRIFNSGATPITLVGATSDMAEAVTLVGGPGAIVTASPAPPTSPEASPTGSPSPAGSPSAAASPSPEASPSPAAASPSPTPSPAVPPTSSRLSIQIPPASYALLVPGQGSFLQLTRLKQPVVPGSRVTMTLIFDNGVSIPIQIPMGPPSTSVPRATPVVPAGEEGHE
jgi:copper(I)-binding protein